MPLMEGKGVSGVIDSLNTVRRLSASSTWLCIDFTIDVHPDANARLV